MLGFTATDSDSQQPLCFLCGKVLSNHAMKPAHMQWHQSTRHQPSGEDFSNFPSSFLPGNFACRQS